MLEAARARHRPLRDEGIVVRMFLYCQGLVRGWAGQLHYARAPIFFMTYPSSVSRPAVIPSARSAAEESSTSVRYPRTLVLRSQVFRFLTTVRYVRNDMEESCISNAIALTLVELQID